MEILKAKYFVETEQPFILPYVKGQNTKYLSKQIKKHYKDVSKAVKRYMEIEDMLSISYASTYLNVLGYRFTVATGLKLLREMEEVKREPFTGKYIINTHPLGVFLSMCSAPCKYTYPNEPRQYIDPLGLSNDMVIEDVNYKIEEFLIQLKYAIEKFNYETEV